MREQAAAVSRSWKVGHRTVTLVVSRPTAGNSANAAFEWDPDVPTRQTDETLPAFCSRVNDRLAELNSELTLIADFIEAKPETGATR